MLAELLRDVEKEKSGHKNPFKPHRSKLLRVRLEDWLGVLKARGCDEEFTGLKQTRVSAIFVGCGFVFIADLSAERLERFLESLRTGPKKLSVQTTNDYLQAASQFCNWLVESERLERNPFTKVQKGNPERDRRHIRRPLDSAELWTLVSGTRVGGVLRRTLTAEARAMLYFVGAQSGYRAGELAALTPEYFLFDAETATIDLSGEFTKNGRDASQPIPAEMVATLRGFLKDRPAGQPVWPGKWVDRSADTIWNDAVAAGLTLDLDTKDGFQVLDFHSLRGTYATFLDEIDMSLKAR